MCVLLYDKRVHEYRMCIYYTGDMIGIWIYYTGDMIGISIYCTGNMIQELISLVYRKILNDYEIWIYYSGKYETTMDFSILNDCGAERTAGGISQKVDF